MKSNPDPADAARISELAEGVPGGLRALVELFVSHTSDAAVQLRTAAAESRATEVRMLAHRGAGSAGAIGAVRLVEVFRQIEAVAANPDLPRLDELVTSLEAELARVHAFLAELIAQRQ